MLPVAMSESGGSVRSASWFTAYRAPSGVVNVSTGSPSRFNSHLTSPLSTSSGQALPKSALLALPGLVEAVRSGTSAGNASGVRSPHAVKVHMVATAVNPRSCLTAVNWVIGYAVVGVRPVIVHRRWRIVRPAMRVAG